MGLNLTLPFEAPEATRCVELLSLWEEKRKENNNRERNPREQHPVHQCYQINVLFFTWLFFVAITSCNKKENM